MMQWLRRVALFWPYLLATGLILGPLLAPGYVLAVDMVFSPHTAWPEQLTSAYPYHAAVHLANSLLPGDWVQKIVLASAFMLSGVGAHRLLLHLQPERVKAGVWQAGVYVGALLYMANPFVYSRFLAGQYLLLLGYALLPVFFLCLWRFLQQLSVMLAAKTTLVAAVIAVFSLHMLGLAISIAVVCGLVRAWQCRRQTEWRQQVVRCGGIGLLVLVGLCSYWIVPLLSGQGEQTATIASFSQADRDAFQAVGGELGLLPNLLALQGFWGDARNLYLLPADYYSWWLLPTLALWALVAVGVSAAWRHTKALVIVFGCLAGIGLVIAASTAVPVLRSVSASLTDVVPFVGGYREPQKFAALIALGYAYFAAWGVASIIQLVSGEHLRRLVFALGCLLPLLLAPLLPWGGRGQLAAHPYPASWHQANTYLKQQAADTQVVFLPWHQYLPVSFAEGVTANPAPAFFEVPVIVSNDPELGGTSGYARQADARSQVASLLAAHRANPGTALAAGLRSLNVSHILLAREFDHADYAYVDRTPGIERVKTYTDLVLYKVEKE